MKSLSKAVRDQRSACRPASLTRTFSLATAAFSVPSPQAGLRAAILLGAPDPSMCYHNRTQLETAPQAFLHGAVDSCRASQTLAMGDLLCPGY